jgi:hypothetical protein
LKATIDGIVYDSDQSKRLAHKANISSDTQLYQTEDGRFFLLILQLYVDGQKLGPDECWLDLRETANIKSRLKVAAEISVLTARQALEWAIKTQIPATFRGYLLESI